MPMPSVSLRALPTHPGTKATFEVLLEAGEEGQQITLAFWEVVRPGEPGSDTRLGSIQGTLVNRLPLVSWVLDSTDPMDQARSQVAVAFVLPATELAASVGHADMVYVFDLPADNFAQHEGEFWEVQARIEQVDNSSTDLRSATFPFARVRRALAVGQQATYDYHEGHEIMLYNDGSVDAAGFRGAFPDIVRAIKEAEHFIFIADWSFHPYFRVDRSAPAGRDETIGSLLIEKARKGKLVAIHTWDHTVKGADDPQNDDGNKHLDTLAGGKRPPMLLWRASSRIGPINSLVFSHHQKFVVLDGPDPNTKGKRRVRAFLGGLDLTTGRFDFPEHPVLGRPTDSFKIAVDGFNDWYNAEFPGDLKVPRQAWHDIHACVDGPAAWDVLREFVGRWSRVDQGNKTLGDSDDFSIRVVQDQFVLLFDKTKFRQQHARYHGPFAVQIYRSLDKEHWDLGQQLKIRRVPQCRWSLGSRTHERSIQDAYLQAISQADRFVYIETQYFISSGDRWAHKGIANQVASALVNRTLDRIQNGLPFHVYIVTPMYPEGSPLDGAGPAQRQFEWNTMQFMIRTLSAKVGESWRDYLSFYFLAQWQDCVGLSTMNPHADRKDRVKASARYMIYVHSKLMIIDDRYLLLGSANLNERSLNGARDSEIGFAMWPAQSQSQHEQRCIDQISDFRKKLWIEHLGDAALPADWQRPEQVSCVRAVRGAADGNWINFREGKQDPKNGHLVAWPLALDPKNNLTITRTSAAPEGDEFIPDSLFNLKGKDDWKWSAPGIHGLASTELAE